MEVFACITAIFLIFLVLLNNHSTHHLFSNFMVGGTWPRVEMPTLHLFPGIAQMTLLSGPSKLHEPCSGNLKGHIPLYHKVKRSQSWLLLHLSPLRLRILIQMVVGQGGIALETCRQNTVEDDRCTGRLPGARARRKGELQAQPSPFHHATSEILLPTGGLPG